MFARAMLFLLIVLNLGVALWWLARADAPPASAIDHAPAGVARLQLAEPVTPVITAPAADAPAQAQDAAQAPEPVAAVEPPAEHCFALGPFADAAAAGAARGRLPATVARSRSRQAAGGSAGWRVALPALADRAAATAMADRIRQAGFNDLYVVAEGAEANSIALGRFGSEAAARAHATALRAAGFEANATQVGTETVFWLDIALADGGDIAAIQRTAGVRRPETIACTGVR